MKMFNTVGIGSAFYVNGGDVKAIRSDAAEKSTIFLTTGHTQALAHSAEYVAEQLGKKLPVEEEAEA